MSDCQFHHQPSVVRSCHYFDIGATGAGLGALSVAGGVISSGFGGINSFLAGALVSTPVLWYGSSELLHTQRAIPSNVAKAAILTIPDSFKW